MKQFKDIFTIDEQEILIKEKPLPSRSFLKEALKLSVVILVVITLSWGISSASKSDLESATDNFSVIGTVSFISEDTVSLIKARGSDTTAEDLYNLNIEYLDKVETNTYDPLIITDIQVGDTIIAQGLTNGSIFFIKRIVSFSSTPFEIQEDLTATSTLEVATSTEDIATSTDDATSTTGDTTEPTSGTTTSTEDIATSTSDTSTTTDQAVVIEDNITIIDEPASSTDTTSSSTPSIIDTVTTIVDDVIDTVVDTITNIIDTVTGTSTPEEIDTQEPIIEELPVEQSIIEEQLIEETPQEATPEPQTESPPVE